VKIYAAINDPRSPLGEMPALARRAEAIGFDGLLVPEAVHDGLLAATLALEHTERLEVATSVLLAFARSPMTVAYAAWDLQSLSDGRFTLGLGSQVKANMVGRYSVTWTPPVERMRDYVGALRAIWHCWRTGGELDFESSNYRFGRMQPFFRPDVIDAPDVPIVIGAVNPKMTRLAGEIADGLVTHPTNTCPRYLRERVIPELERGAGQGDRAGTRANLVASTFVATGADRSEVAAELERLRGYLAFLYSTPHYWPTLEALGVADLGRRLHDLSRRGAWEEMAGLVDDDILMELVASGTYEEIGAVLHRWYADVADAITLRVPDDPAHDAALTEVLADLKKR
jgi:probable F420-dependent oxidoreductase